MHQARAVSEALSPPMLTPPVLTPHPGRDALLRGAWDEARAHFMSELAERESPEALEQLALAAWWLDDAALTFDSRERAYGLYRERGDSLGAARVAVWLVWDYLAFRGDFAVASGWLQRARRILTGHEESVEYGWLLLREGEMALFRGHDSTAARDSAARGAELGRRLNDRDLEFTGLALEGIARVSAGDVEGGMRCLDEATAAATAGEFKALASVGVVCCWQIFACESVRDYDRAAQWCSRVHEFTKRWRLRPLSAVCRTQYAGVLIWRGEWAEAESELETATQDFEKSRPPMVMQAIARLGELRLRQGRFDEAKALFDRAPAQQYSRLGHAALALEQGSAAEAAATLERFLEQMGEHEPTARSGALELAIHAHSACGDLAAADRALVELRRISIALGTVPMAASVARADGALLRARGDMTDAANALERAIELYEQSGAPFETAQSRLMLAEVLVALDQSDEAERQARVSAKAFETLSAEHYAARARALFGGESAAASLAHRSGTKSLTGRQVEILRLLAQGLSNTQIAERLGLSDHTVKRHVANLFNRLGLSSRAAAVAYAARQGLL